MLCSMLTPSNGRPRWAGSNLNPRHNVPWNEEPMSDAGISKVVVPPFASSSNTWWLIRCMVAVLRQQWLARHLLSGTCFSVSFLPRAS